MIYKVKIYLSVILFCACINTVRSESRTYTVNIDDWARPRSGEVVTQFESLQQLVKDWSLIKEGIIVIHYPGGEMGNLWAQELKDWLVSLGIPSKQIDQLSGSGNVDRIDLIIKAD